MLSLASLGSPAATLGDQNDDIFLFCIDFGLKRVCNQRYLQNQAASNRAFEEVHEQLYYVIT
ncbi:MAG: hypothetical protein AAF546_09870 [Verrucomicrobiota bacterium]